MFHSKMTFLDNIRMTRLISLVDGKNHSVNWIKQFYASTLKTLKRDFGNLVLVATLRIKRFFNKPQIDGRNRNILGEFQQQL